jgi:hypothetical protein
MSLINLKSKIRFLLGDNSTSGEDIFTYGSSNVFTISESNVIVISSVLVNDSIVGVVYTYSSTTNKITITSSLTSGDIITVKYTYYPNYSDSELLSYIQASLVHLSINNYADLEYDAVDDTIYPDLEPREENLIAILSSILIQPDNKTIKLPDVTINVPSDYPTDEKIKRTISAFRRDNVGIFDIL